MDPFLDWSQQLPPPVQVQEYLVHAILTLNCRGGETVLPNQLRRLGLGLKHSGEPAAHVHAPDLLKRFHQDPSDKPGPVPIWRKDASGEGDDIRIQGLEPRS